MSNRSSRELKPWVAIIPAELTDRQTTHVLWAAGNRALDLQPSDPLRQYVAEFLGHLFDAADRRSQQNEALMRSLPAGDAPKSPLWVTFTEARHEMQRSYGDPQLAGVEDTPFRPVLGQEVAERSQGSIDLIRTYMGSELVGE